MNHAASTEQWSEVKRCQRRQGPMAMKTEHPLNMRAKSYDLVREVSSCTCCNNVHPAVANYALRLAYRTQFVHVWECKVLPSLIDFLLPILDSDFTGDDSRPACQDREGSAAGRFRSASLYPGSLATLRLQIAQPQHTEAPPRHARMQMAVPSCRWRA